MNYDLRSVTTANLVRLYCRVWDRMTAADGYQPFGYDNSTMWATHPEWMEIREAIRTEGCRRFHS